MQIVAMLMKDVELKLDMSRDAWQAKHQMMKPLRCVKSEDGRAPCPIASGF